MRAFADLYAALDETTRTTAKVEALVRYFADAPARRRGLGGLLPDRPQAAPGRAVEASSAHWAAEEAGIPDWLFDECYDAVGDLAETIALLLPPPERSSDRPLAEWVDRLLPLRDRRRGRASGPPSSTPGGSSTAASGSSCNKLISGAFRVGVSQQLVTRALARSAGSSRRVVAHRLMGDWEPTAAFFDALLAPPTPRDADLSRPYPFCLAHPLDEAAGPEAPRRPGGLAGRVEVGRHPLPAHPPRGRTFLWTRGEELVTDRYPELAGLGADAARRHRARRRDPRLPRRRPPCPSPSSSGGSAGRRSARSCSPRSRSSSSPTTCSNTRGPTSARAAPRAPRACWPNSSAATNVPGRLLLSPTVEGDHLGRPGRRPHHQPRAAGRGPDAQAARLGLSGRPGPGRLVEVEGCARSRRRRADRRPARERQAGQPLHRLHLQRLGRSGRLVPIAKAYSGLTDAEIRRVDAFVRRHMVEKFGPVRTVDARAGLRAGLRGHPAARPGTSRASPSASPGSSAGGPTRPPPTPIGWRRSGRCSPKARPGPDPFALFSSPRGAGRQE